MFRRRPFGRPLRPLRRNVPPQIPPLLQRANRMMADGRYQEAAEAFENLAITAHTRGILRAPWLFLQAGRARILAGQEVEGLAHLKQGLAILAGRSDWSHLRQSGRRVVTELRERGLEQEAAGIETWLEATLPAAIQEESAQGAFQQKPTLPTHCPSCGAALRPDEVEWLDSVTAECAYCGSPVR